MSDVKKMIEGKIAGKKVMVFSKKYCPYCAKAKKVLAEYNLSPEDYEVLEIENDPNCNQIQRILGQMTGGSSVSEPSPLPVPSYSPTSQPLQSLTM
jgi:glutaredoxin 3